MPKESILRATAAGAASTTLADEVAELVSACHPSDKRGFLAAGVVSSTRNNEFRQPLSAPADIARSRSDMACAVELEQGKVAGVEPNVYMQTG